MEKNPIADLIAQKKELLTSTNFIKKNKNSVWTNGTDTLSFEFITTKKSDKIELFTFNGISTKQSLVLLNVACVVMLGWI